MSELPDFWPPNHDSTLLPAPTVEATSDEPTTEAHVRGIVCNPIYAGLNEYPRLVPDELWIRTAIKMIEEDGAAQFCVNLLHMLRHTQAQSAMPTGTLPRYVVVDANTPRTIMSGVGWPIAGWDNRDEAQKALDDILAVLTTESGKSLSVVSTDRLVFDQEIGAPRACPNHCPKT